MNYATIKNCDIANGPGVRVSLFVSGCTHRCPGCFNEVAWDFNYGEPFTQDKYPLEKEMATHSKYLCLGNPMVRGTWGATVHVVTKELDTTERLNNNSNIIFLM